MHHSDVLEKLNSFMRNVADDNLHELIQNMQASLDYAMEKLKIYEEILALKTKCAQPKLSDSQKRRLAQHGKKLNEYILSTIETTFSPSTIRGWYHQLIGNKYSTNNERAKRSGRKTISMEIIQSILRLSKNTEWGYKRIADYMKYLGYNVSPTTVKKVLDDHGITPDPERQKRGDWDKFISAHQHVIAATDFATAEILTENGVERHHILFFEDIMTREVKLGGICHNPNGKWMKQIARYMCDMWDGFLLGKKYIIHDCDPLFTHDFSMIMKSIGITCKKITPRQPNMNAYIESFIGSFRSECLDKLIPTSKEQLYYIVQEYLEYYNHERPHRGLGGAMIKPHSQDPDGEIMEFSRLGGLLLSYRRIKVVA